MARNMEGEEWDDFVKNVSGGHLYPCYTPEGAMESYQWTNKRLTNVRERLKNPVNLKGGGPLKPATIRQLEREEKDLIRKVAHYQKFIKKLVKYNLLPTSKLISGDRRQFVFSLWTMLELPELGKAVYYANRLMGSRYDWCKTPSTNEDYVKWKSQPGTIPQPKEERSRESMYDALINSLNETIEHVQKERQRLIFSGTPWHPPKTDPDFTDNKITDVAFNDPANTRLVKEPMLNPENGYRASNPQNVSDEQAVAEPEQKEQGIAAPEQVEMPTDQRRELRNMKKDTFVNLDLLYEKIDKLLEDMDTNVFMAKHWLQFESKPNGLDSCWVPDEVKSDIRRSKEESEKARALLRKIRRIMCDFKMKKHQKPANVISVRVRVGHMNVIYGGQYKSMEPKVQGGILSSVGAAFLEKERGCESSGNEVSE